MEKSKLIISICVSRVEGLIMAFEKIKSGCGIEKKFFLKNFHLEN